MLRNPVSPPSYGLTFSIYVSIFLKVFIFGLIKRIPALKLSGGNTSGAAANRASGWISISMNPSRTVID